MHPTYKILDSEIYKVSNLSQFIFIKDLVWTKSF